MDENEMSQSEQTYYRTLVRQTGTDYSSGSLRELEIVAEMFRRRGSTPVNVYLVSDDWDEDELFASEDNQEMMRPAFDGAEKSKYYITTTERHDPQPREYRHLTAWIKEQYRLLRGERGLLPPNELILRYYFQKMEWNGRAISQVYYNLDTRKVYMRFG